MLRRSRCQRAGGRAAERANAGPAHRCIRAVAFRHRHGPDRTQGSAAGRSVGIRQRQMVRHHRDSPGQGRVQRRQQDLRRHPGAIARHRREGKRAGAPEAGRTAAHRRSVSQLHGRGSARSAGDQAACRRIRPDRCDQEQTRRRRRYRASGPDRRQCAVCRAGAPGQQGLDPLRRRSRAGRPRHAGPRLLSAGWRRQAERRPRQVPDARRADDGDGRRSRRDAGRLGDRRARDRARQGAVDQGRAARPDQGLQQGRARQARCARTGLRLEALPGQRRRRGQGDLSDRRASRATSPPSPAFSTGRRCRYGRRISAGTC